MGKFFNWIVLFIDSFFNKKSKEFAKNFQLICETFVISFKILYLKYFCEKQFEKRFEMLNQIILNINFLTMFVQFHLNFWRLLHNSIIREFSSSNLSNSILWIHLYLEPGITQRCTQHYHLNEEFTIIQIVIKFKQSIYPL